MLVSAGPALVSGPSRERNFRVSHARLKSGRADELTPFPTMGSDPATVFHVRGEVCQLVAQDFSVIDER